VIPAEDHFNVLLLFDPPSTVIPAPLAVVFVGLSTTASSMFLSEICTVVELVNCVSPTTVSEPVIVVFALT
jgi:hypothetical protein